jgi:hypothetical protein
MNAPSLPVSALAIAEEINLVDMDKRSHTQQMIRMTDANNTQIYQKNNNHEPLIPSPGDSTGGTKTQGKSTEALIKLQENRQRSSSSLANIAPGASHHDSKRASIGESSQHGQRHSNSGIIDPNQYNSKQGQYIV